MPRNPHRPGASASQSFVEEDVEFLHQLCTILTRGGDTSIMVRSEPFRRLRKKVDVMKKSIVRQKASLG